MKWVSGPCTPSPSSSGNTGSRSAISTCGNSTKHSPHKHCTAATSSEPTRQVQRQRRCHRHRQHLRHERRPHGRRRPLRTVTARAAANGRTRTTPSVQPRAIRSSNSVGSEPGCQADGGSQEFPMLGRSRGSVLSCSRKSATSASKRQFSPRTAGSARPAGPRAAPPTYRTQAATIPPARATAGDTPTAPEPQSNCFESAS